MAARIESGSRRGVLVSALTGVGTDDLLDAIDRALDGGRRAVEISLPPWDGAALAWLYERGAVLERQDGPEEIRLRVNLDEAELHRFRLHAARGAGPEAGEKTADRRQI